MKFFVLAGGYGKRAEPLSLVKPKPAFPLGGVPLLARLLRQLRDLECAQGFVNLHHLAGQVVAAAGGGDGIRFFEEKELSGSRVLRRALPFVADGLLVLNGDTFLEIPLAGMRLAAADTGADGVLLVRRDETGRYARLIVGGDGFLERTEPASASARGGLMYAGAALFSKSALAKVDETNFFTSIRKHGLRFRVLAYEGLWLDIGTPASYFQANWDYMARHEPPGGSPQGANALSPDVVVSRRSRVERCVLWENTRVGPGVRLSECVVTGGMELRDACHSRQIVSRLGVWPLFADRG